jgi:hypothetical protein
MKSQINAIAKIVPTQRAYVLKYDLDWDTALHHR